MNTPQCTFPSNKPNYMSLNTLNIHEAYEHPLAAVSSVKHFLLVTLMWVFTVY